MSVWAGWGSLVAVFVVAFAYAGISIERNIDAYDEGIVLVGADLVSRGYIPHRDFYTQYAPGQFYLVAGLFRIFGHSVLIERAWDCAARALLTVAVYAATRAVATRHLALCAAAATLAWQGAFWIAGTPVMPALAAVVASLRFLLPERRSDPAGRDLFIAGGCMGAATLFRYDFGLAGCALGCISIAGARIASPDDAPSYLAWVKAPLPFLAGCMTMILPLAIWLAWCGALPDMLFDFTTATKLYVKMRSLPLSGLGALRTDPASFGVYLPPLTCVAALVSVTSLLRRRVRHAATSRAPPEAVMRAIQTVILASFTLLFCVKGFVRVSNVQMSMALIVSTVLLAQVTASWRAQGAASRAMTGVALGAAVFFAFYAAHAGWQRASANMRFLAGSAWSLPQTSVALAVGPCRMPPALARMACVPLAAATADTIRYIDTHTRPSAPIFVGLPRHDRLVANDIALYFEAARQPATRWYHFDPGLTTSAPIQRQMVDDLVRAKPQLIVIEAIFQGAHEPNASAVSSGVTILDDYLRRSFKAVAGFGPYVVMAPAN